MYILFIYISIKIRNKGVIGHQHIPGSQVSV